MRSLRLGLGVLVISVGFGVGCGEQPHPEARLAIDIAPLRLDGITDATWRLTVTTPASATPVWQRTITSSTYGDGRGSATYVGPCDASPAANPNRVSLELLELRDAGGALTDPTDFKNPAPAGSPVFVDRTCLPNADVPVTFDLTVMRRANQGFFDVAVNFEDLFCSAKIDCERDNGATLDLLFDPTSGDRIPTVVMTLACTGGLAADTHLWLDRPLLTCGGNTIALPIDGDEPGQVFVENPPGPIRQLATYRGKEALTGPGGVSWAKVYANVAVAVDPGQVCSLTAVASASDGYLDALTTPSGAYPLIRWNIPALTDATRPVCGRRPLDEPLAPAGTGTFTSYTTSTAETFDFGLKADPGSSSRLVVLRGGDLCGDSLCTGAETAQSCPEDCLATCSAGMWGPRCDQPCSTSNCAAGLVCDRFTGVATACTTCVQGFWGATCGSVCVNPTGCSGTPTCERDTGAVLTCASCLPGFFGPTCESDWWDPSFTRRSQVTVTSTFIPAGATHVQVPIDVDTICYGTKLPNLLYAYHFDEGQGTTLESREGHAGFATLDRGGTFQPGVEGTALRLDGASQWVDLPDLLPTTHTMTLAAWFKLSALPSGYPAVVSAWGTSGQSGGEVYIMSLTEAQSCWNSGTGVKLIQKVHPVGQPEHGNCNADTLETDRWYFAALSYNGRIERSYLDGEEEVFHDYGAVSTLEPSSALRLGVARDLATHFPGDVDSVMLFDGYLDDTDVESLMAPNCRRDLGDLRLVDSTTGQVYPHWRESDTRVVARVPVAALNHTLHLYHGNPSATSTSNGPATFERFEGFDGGAFQSSWSLTAGCAGTGVLPTLTNGRLAATGDCGVLASSTSYGNELLRVAVDVFKPVQTGEVLGCVDARLGWAGVNVLGTLKLDNFNPEWGELDLVGIGAAHECNQTTGLIGSFNLGTFELNQISNGIYVSRYSAVDALSVEGPLPFQFAPAKGALALHAAGTSDAPRYFDNVRVSVAANVTATLSPPCVQGACATYRWVDVGPRTEPMRTATCVNGSGASATCDAANLGRRVHVDTTGGSTLQFRAVGSGALEGSVSGGAAFAATLSGDGATLDYTGRGSGCTGMTTSLVTLEHVYECQLVP